MVNFYCNFCVLGFCTRNFKFLFLFLFFLVWLITLEMNIIISSNLLLLLENLKL